MSAASTTMPAAFTSHSGNLSHSGPGHQLPLTQPTLGQSACYAADLGMLRHGCCWEGSVIAFLSGRTSQLARVCFCGDAVAYVNANTWYCVAIPQAFGVFLAAGSFLQCGR